MTTKKAEWWKDEIFYQIYPRSFQDSNGDGVGDLQGIISRLDYLQDLGITTIWLSPIYKSPMYDMGYDVADYEAIDPIFGTMADFDELLAEANKRHIKIIMDLVVNHTSNQHEWFKQALADPKSKYRDYYIFKHSDDGKVPNNWRSIFGGSTWEPVPNEPGTYYFNSFSPQQPDLNWENPQLRQVIYKMINWWLEKGVAGFRIDAINFLKKDQDWSSLPPDAKDGLVSVIHKGQNRPGLEKFLAELKKATFDKYDAVTIGEAYGLKPSELKRLVGKHGYFSMIFDFSYMNIDINDGDEWFRGQNDWSVSDLRELIFDSQRGIKEADGWFANVLENHDQPRVLSKLIKKAENRTPKAAKALAVMYFFLPGDPFIYQGQEIGMKNFTRASINEFNDISSLNNYQLELDEGFTPEEALKNVNLKSRDNARTPMQWDGSSKAGFTTGTPWLALGNDRKGINVADELKDPNSVLNFYQPMIKFRQAPKIKPLMINGDLQAIANEAEQVIAYEMRYENHFVTVLVNLTDQEVSLEKTYAGELALSNENGVELGKQTHVRNLNAYQAVVLYN
ncbi:glycoside hydrolase family 13 protein [Fructilactobacillus frigidiflavus]|uniref:glycoside hydrolase family 13 protein n=1 Tax=Fructilactobacillus frigidiflavus TaxID=3242688 RepID=UPI003757BE2B